MYTVFNLFYQEYFIHSSALVYTLVQLNIINSLFILFIWWLTITKSKISVIT